MEKKLSKKQRLRRINRKNKRKNQKIRDEILEEGIPLELHVAGSEGWYCIQNLREVEEGRSFFEAYPTLGEAMEEVVWYEVMRLFEERLEKERKGQKRKRK